MKTPREMAALLRQLELMEQFALAHDRPDKAAEAYELAESYRKLLREDQTAAA